MPDVLVEACVDSVVSAMDAERAGADRVELCANLREGGTTPTVGTLEACRERLAVPVFVMIRPRPGDFCHDEVELDVMVRDIRVMRERGAQGFVFGVLTPGGDVAQEALKRLLDEARRLPVTFHRAFDLARDSQTALDTLLRCGVDRLLTSGAAPTAVEGAGLIERLVRQAGDSLVVMAGGGVRAGNAAEIVRRTGVREIHTGPSRRVDGPMRFRSAAARVEKGGGDPFARDVIDDAEVRAIVRAVRGR
jgi:copper homeostasis protein